MIEAQAARLAELQNEEDERVESQVKAKEASDEKKRLDKEELMSRWNEDINKSRAAQIERKRAQREKDKGEDCETAKFLGEWCKVLDKQEQEELEMKNAANRKLASEHKKMVEIQRRRTEDDKKGDAGVAIHAKKALESDTLEFHTYAENASEAIQRKGRTLFL